MNNRIIVLNDPVNFVDPDGLFPKGERNWSKRPSGTKNPWKHYRPHPTNPNKVLYKDPQTGKDKIKPKPPGFPVRNIPVLLLFPGQEEWMDDKLEQFDPPIDSDSCPI